MTDKQNNLIISAAIGASTALPLTGFIYGMIVCQGCNMGIEGFLGRIFVGIVEMFLTIITLGCPVDNEGGTSSTNLRGYVLICFVVVAGITYLIRSRKTNKTTQ
ncbi:MAG: hypothetical protein ABI388_03625 [Bacteroidia bacterium]